MDTGKGPAGGFESLKSLKADYGQYQSAVGFLSESEYEDIVRCARKGRGVVFAGDKSDTEQKRKFAERAQSMTRGLDIGLLGDKDPRVLVFVLLSTNIDVQRKYSGKLGSEMLILAEALRIAGDISSRGKLIRANNGVAFPK